MSSVVLLGQETLRMSKCTLMLIQLWICSACQLSTSSLFLATSEAFTNIYLSPVVILLSITGPREQRRSESPVSTVSDMVLPWESNVRSWKSNNTLDTTVLSVVRSLSEEMLLVSGLVSLVRSPLQVVLTLSPLQLLQPSDLPSDV